MVMYTPVSAGETNVRPSRPRPPVCSSANSVKPCLRPRYCSFIVVLDEVSDGSTRISLSDDRGIEQRVNACGGQAVVIRGQAIAFSGHGVNGKAALAQCGDRLVHRRTGYAKLLGQPSAGKAGASCLFECLQNGVLHGQFDHLHH